MAKTALAASPQADDLQARIKTAAAAIAQPASRVITAEEFIPLIREACENGLARELDTLLAAAGKKEEYGLFLALNRQIMADCKERPREQAFFHAREAEMNLTLGAEAEALVCYSAAAELDPPTFKRTYKALVREVEARAAAQKRELVRLWKRAADAAAAQAYAVEKRIGLCSEIISQLQSDIFSLAEETRDTLLKKDQAIANLIQWLLGHKDINIYVQLSETAKSHYNAFSLPGKISAHMLLWQIESAFFFANFYEELFNPVSSALDAFREDILDRLCKGRTVAPSEVLLLCLAIKDDGLVFPSRMAALKKTSLNQNIITDFYCKQLYRQLTQPLLAELSAAAASLDPARAFAAAKELGQVFPLDSSIAKEALCHAHSLKATALIVKGGNFAAAKESIKAMRFLDPESVHIDRTLIVYFRAKKNYGAAARHAERAVEKSKKERSRGIAASNAVEFFLALSVKAKTEAEKTSFFEQAKKYLEIAYSLRPFCCDNSLAGIVLACSLKNGEEVLVWVDRFIACFTQQFPHPDQAINNLNRASHSQEIIAILAEMKNEAAFFALTGQFDSKIASLANLRNSPSLPATP